MIINPVKCGMKLLIHSETSFGERISEFIPHFSFAGEAYVLGWFGVCVVVCRVANFFQSVEAFTVYSQYFEILHTWSSYWCPKTCGIKILILWILIMKNMQKKWVFWRF